MSNSATSSSVISGFSQQVLQTCLDTGEWSSKPSAFTNNKNNQIIKPWAIKQTRKIKIQTKGVFMYQNKPNQITPNSQALLRPMLPARQPGSSCPTVNLINNRVLTPRIPLPTHLLHLTWHPISSPSPPHLVRLCQKAGNEPSRRMPPDMAMKRPYTRIVCIKLQHQVPVGPDNLGVSSHGVGRADNRLTVPVAGAGGENVEVIPVEVHWVSVFSTVSS